MLVKLLKARFLMHESSCGCYSQSSVFLRIAGIKLKLSPSKILLLKMSNIQCSHCKTLTPYIMVYCSFILYCILYWWQHVIYYIGKWVLKSKVFNHFNWHCSSVDLANMIWCIKWYWHGRICETGDMVVAVASQLQGPWCDPKLCVQRFACLRLFFYSLSKTCQWIGCISFPLVGMSVYLCLCVCLRMCMMPCIPSNVYFVLTLRE